MQFRKKITTVLLALMLLGGIIPEVSAYTKPALEKIEGNNYEVAAKIADKQKYTSAILVNLDKSIADGLSSSGLAGATSSPILLTQQDSIPDVTMKRLESVKKIYIIGGTNSVTANVESKLKSKGKEVERIEGSNRAATSIKVANKVKTFVDSKYIFLSNGYKGEADAISIAPVAARYKAPIILTDGNQANYQTSGKECYVIGGKTSMNDKIVADNKADRLGGADRFATNSQILDVFFSEGDDFANVVGLNFYIADGYNLTSGLITAPVAKYAPLCLVSEKSDKRDLLFADKITAVGKLSDKTINDALDPLPVICDMFGYWESENDDRVFMQIASDSISWNWSDSYEEIDNASYRVSSVDKSKNTVVLMRTDKVEYYRLTKLSDDRFKFERSKDNKIWNKAEFYNHI
ncbi:MAG: cell wall-binding repeat-containing protein [Clostridioides sp.]|jgi:putative cell wall-binding protein|nr:cell wall-binding repeat-containing protein [Clostridioides sp.]